MKSTSAQLDRLRARPLFRGGPAALVAAVLVAAVLACGCAAEPDAEPLGRGAPRDRRVLRYDNVVEPASIDPAHVGGRPGAFLARQLFDGLTRLDPDTLEVRPALAESWRAEEDGRVWIFRLREDARWSDGEPITAEDVVASYARALRPSTRARNAHRLFPIENARAYHRGVLARVRSGDLKLRRPPFVVFGDSGALEPPAQVALEAGAVVRAIDSNVRVARGAAPLPLRARPSVDAAAEGTIEPLQRAIVLGRQVVAPEQSGAGTAWVQLRPPDGGTAGWALEADLLPAFPPVDARRVVGDRRHGDRAPLYEHARDEGAPFAYVEDDDEVEVLAEDGAFVRVVHVGSGVVGFMPKDLVDEIVRERTWFLVEVERGDGTRLSGWVPTEKLALDPTLLGARALDARTIRIALEEPVAWLPALASTTAWRPVPVRVVERHGSSWTSPDRIRTSGPFRLAAHVPQDRFELARDGAHPLADQGTLERAVVYAIADRPASVTLYASGFLDATAPASLPGELAPALRARPDYVEGRALSTSFLALNAGRPPLSDARVRRALALSLDRDRLVEVERKGGMRPATSLVPPGVSTYPGVRGLPRDPERARALLAEAGFPGGRGMPRLSLVVVRSAGHDAMAAEIARQWRRELGVEVQLVRLSHRAALEAQRDGLFHAARVALTPELPDPTAFLEVLDAESGENETRWRSDAYSALLAAAAEAQEPERRFALLAEAEQAMLDEAPIVPLAFFDDGFLRAPYVRGLSPNVLDLHDLAAVSLVEDPSADGASP